MTWKLGFQHTSIQLSSANFGMTPQAWGPCLCTSASNDLAWLVLGASGWLCGEGLTRSSGDTEGGGRDPGGSGGGGRSGGRATGPRTPGGRGAGPQGQQLQETGSPGYGCWPSLASFRPCGTQLTPSELKTPDGETPIR